MHNQENRVNSNHDLVYVNRRSQVLNQYNKISVPKLKPIKTVQMEDPSLMSETLSEQQVVEMKGTEKVFKVTDPVPPEMPSQSTYLNSHNSFNMFLDKDKYKRDVFK